MAFAIKPSEPVSRIASMIILNVMVAAAFLFLCFSCFHQWNKIVATAMMVGVESPIVDFMMPFFRFSVISSVACLFFMLLAMAGLLCCFTIGKAVHEDEISELFSEEQAV